MPARDFGELPAELRAMTPRLRRSLRAALTDAAQPIAADARARASWSTRIPGAVTVAAAVSRGSQVVVRFRVSADVAPHARAYEGLSARGSASVFRHPVFGHRERWVPQAARPFIEPALRAGREGAMRAVGDAVQATARDAGFR